jgi:hypothetical protein
MTLSSTLPMLVSLTASSARVRALATPAVVIASLIRSTCSWVNPLKASAA